LRFKITKRRPSPVLIHIAQKTRNTLRNTDRENLKARLHVACRTVLQS
jgi:hypothetical protein